MSWVGILQARHLHQDAVVARARDVGLFGAQFVDAAAHHFDGLVHHLLAGQRLVGIGHLQGEDAAAGLGHLIFLAAHRQDRTGHVGIEALRSACAPRPCGRYR